MDMASEATVTTQDPPAEPLPAEAEASAPPLISITREEEASRIIAKYVGWGAGSGAIPLPLWDVAAVGTVQVLLVRDLLRLYDVPFSEARVRSVIAVLIGSLSPGALAGTAALTLGRIVPGIGTALASVTLPILTSAATYAVGKVMHAHLAAGGTLENVETRGMRERMRSAFEEGKARAKAAVNALAGRSSVAAA